ncbi:MAG: hypothetical protein KF683_00365 [Rubrivivax sp.]|nr:hypothetical protein [Rubrivivax sp.]
MSALLKLFDPLRQAAAAFFRHDLKLERNGAGVHVVLEERAAPGKPRPPSRAEAAAAKEQAELALIRTQLKELLDELPETRQTMRHLVFVEQALAKKGLKALRKVPLDVLQRALDQFEGLVTNWSPEGLANLRSKMAVTIIDREHQDAEDDNDAHRTAAVLDHAPPSRMPEPLPDRSEDEALAAAYAALGNAAPVDVEVELQPELPGARGARKPSRSLPRDEAVSSEIRIKALVD